MTSSQAPSAPVRFPGLDTLRAAAILIVVLYHLDLQGMVPAALSPCVRVGWIGVDLFFVLSGFLIGSQLLRPYRMGERPSLRAFYARRAFRILPAFAVVLALYLVCPLWREAPGPYDAWQYACFLWNLLLLGYPQHRALSHVWSLCAEEHFYLLLPLLLLGLMRSPSVRNTAFLLLFLVGGGIGLRAWLLHAFVQPADDRQGQMMMKLIYYPTYSRLDGLVVGVTLAALRTFRTQWWTRFTRHGNLLTLLGLASVVGGLRLCAFNFPTPDLPASILFAFPALALGFGLLVASATCGNGALNVRVPGASLLATLAYSLYLTHKSVAHATHSLLPRLTADGDWRSLAIYAVACLAVASLLYFGVERPFLNLRTRRQTAEHKALATDREIRLDPAI